jgi:hypothetical protein
VERWALARRRSRDDRTLVASLSGRRERLGGLKPTAPLGLQQITRSQCSLSGLFFSCSMSAPRRSSLSRSSGVRLCLRT